MYFSYFDCPYRFLCEDFFVYNIPQFARYPENIGGIQPMLPPGPPPAFIPSKINAKAFSFQGGPGTFQIGTGLITTCVNEFIYLWPRNQNGYWSWVNNIVDRQYISGLRWTGSGWVNFSERISNMEGYYCYNPFRI